MTILAFDLGASSGRAYAGHVDGGLIKAEEIHRFPNQPFRRENTFIGTFSGFIMKSKKAF